MKSTLTASFAAGLALWLIAGFVSHRSIETLSENDRWVAHSHEVVGQLTVVLSTIQDAETGPRGYVLTGEERFLGTYRQALARIDQVLDTLESLVSDNDQQLDHVAQLRQLIHNKLAMVAETVRARGRPYTGFLDALRLVQANQGEQTMTEIRELIATMRDEEVALLHARSEQSKDSARRAFLTLPIVTALGVVLLALLTGVAWSELRQRQRVETGLRQAKEILDERVGQRTNELAAANEVLSREVEERKRAEQEVSRNAQRYRSLVEATTAIVWNTPASGEFETEQSAWSAFTGQTFAQLKGWGWLDAVHLADRPLTRAVWSEAVASHCLYQVEHRLRRRDGEYRHMSVRAVPLVGDDGAIREWIGVHTDVDAQKRVETALRNAKETAEAASHSKSEFLANMSHEIRTPMNGILGLTELLLATELTKEQRDDLEAIHNSADALLIIINDLLDFSKIEAGKLELEPIEFNLHESVDATLKVLEERAHQRGLDFICHIEPEVPQIVAGDPGRLRQVLLNLVGNAIKFTDRGEVVVHVDLANADADRLMVRFAVRDTGVGIPSEKQQSIFEPFVQADGSVTRRFGGTGLGLSISLRLVQLMGGRIVVDSEVGKGSAFQFTAVFGRSSVVPALGVSRASEKVETGILAAQHDSSPPAQSSLRVLVAEDNVINQMVVVRMLEKMGHRVEVVDNGREALAALDRQNFDLVLMDVQMPVLSGFEATAAIRASEHGGKRLPIIAVTAHALRGDRERCLAAGMDGYLSKPINGAELAQALRTLIPGVDVRADAPVRAETSDAAVLDLAATFDSYGGDRAFVQTLARLLLQQSEAMLAEIAEGLSRGDLTTVGRLAHKLAGAVSSLAAPQATAAARKFEALVNSGARCDATAFAGLEKTITRLRAALNEFVMPGSAQQSRIPVGALDAEVSDACIP